MKYAHKRLARALQNGNDFPAATLGLALPFLGHGHPHGVSVQRSAGFGSLHKDVFLLAFNPHEDKSLTGHHGRSYIFRNNSLFGFFLLTAGPFLAASTPFS